MKIYQELTSQNGLSLAAAEDEEDFLVWGLLLLGVEVFVLVFLEDFASASEP
jgi:hypothetical protein